LNLDVLNSINKSNIIQNIFDMLTKFNEIGL